MKHGRLRTLSMVDPHFDLFVKFRIISKESFLISGGTILGGNLNSKLLLCGNDRILPWIYFYVLFLVLEHAFENQDVYPCCIGICKYHCKAIKTTFPETAHQFPYRFWMNFENNLILRWKGIKYQKFKTF